MLAWICCGGLVDGFDSVTVHTSNRFQHVALCSFKSVIFWAILLDLRWVFWDFTDLGSSISARVQELNESKHKHTPIYFDAVWKNATKSVWKQIWEGSSGICTQNSNYNHLTVVSYMKRKYSQVCWNILRQWHATHINSWHWYLQLATKWSKCSIYCCKNFSQGCWSSKVQSAALAEVRYT